IRATESTLSDTEHETHFPAVGYPTQAHARLFGPDEDPWGSRRDSRPPRQGAQAPGRLIRRVRRRLARCRMSANPDPVTAVATQARAAVVVRWQASTSCCRAAFRRLPGARWFPPAPSS